MRGGFVTHRGTFLAGEISLGLPRLAIRLNPVNGKWIASNERTVYDTQWIKVDLYDVKLPDGTEIEHHIVRAGKGGAGVVVHDPEKGVLLIWRHRLTGNAWGWEIPGGRIDDGESPVQAAGREVLEETGWRPGKLTPLFVSQPLVGLVDHEMHFFLAEGATWEGPGADPNEAADIAWVPLSQVLTIMSKGEMVDGSSALALLWAMQLRGLSR